MIEVHHLNNSRSQRVLWMLEEIGVDYQIIRYQRDAQTMLAPPSLKAIHPLGKSPVIRDGDLVVAESGVIVEYLAERYGNGRFMPPSGTAEQLRCRYWVHYAEGSLMTQFIAKLYVGRVGEAASAMLERINGNIHLHLSYVETSLGASQFFAGNELSAADVMMSFPLEVADSQGILRDGYPRTRALLTSLHARPAYQKALEKGGPYAFAK